MKIIACAHLRVFVIINIHYMNLNVSHVAVVGWCATTTIQFFFFFCFSQSILHIKSVLLRLIWLHYIDVSLDGNEIYAQHALLMVVNSVIPSICLEKSSVHFHAHLFFSFVRSFVCSIDNAPIRCNFLFHIVSGFQRQVNFFGKLMDFLWFEAKNFFTPNIYREHHHFHI